MSFSFGATGDKNSGGGGFNFTTPATTAASTGFLLGSGDANAPKLSTPATSAPSTSLGQSLLQKPATTSGTSTSSIGFALPSSSTGFTLGSSSIASTTSIPSTAISTSAPQTSLATSTVVTNSSSASGTSLNFCQLEENINKWTIELEEQEKMFMNQAIQVNNWDRLLIANGEKIVSLNNAVERVKLEQQQVDHELDFILAQQRELEDCLAPLEKELSTTSVSDPEREHTYQLAENLDSQLKQMSEDLKEIIEHLNEMNRTSKDTKDPIRQIGRILNAHMNSLHWIDQSIAQIDSNLEQVSKLHDVHRRENERSFHLTYN